VYFVRHDDRFAARIRRYARLEQPVAFVNNFQDDPGYASHPSSISARRRMRNQLESPSIPTDGLRDSVRSVSMFQKIVNEAE
jgi:hypothetical protein